MPLVLDFPVASTDHIVEPEPIVRLAAENGDTVYCFDEETGILDLSMSDLDIKAVVALNGGLPLRWLSLPLGDTELLFLDVRQIRSVPTTEGGFLLNIANPAVPPPVPPVSPSIQDSRSRTWQRLLVLITVVLVIIVAIIGVVKWRDGVFLANSLHLVYCPGEPYGPGLLTSVRANGGHPCPEALKAYRP